MRRIEAYKVDAFTDTPFRGNAAGVVPDAKGLTEIEMQQIAREMNVSETAFLLPARTREAATRLRYFTPTAEVRLCGHATVATFALLVELGRVTPRRLKLETLAGLLDVEITEEGIIWMGSDPLVVEPAPIDEAEVARLLGTEQVSDVWLVNRKLFALVPDLKTLESLRPQLPDIAQLHRQENVDGFVPVALETMEKENLTHIRYFVPGVGIDEDPVTGTAHMGLAAYLLKLEKISSPTRFTGEQGHFCGRPGIVTVEVEGDANAPRVRVGGTAVVSLDGHLRLP